jgi:hypothetical protein
VCNDYNQHNFFCIGLLQGNWHVAGQYYDRFAKASIEATTAEMQGLWFKTLVIIKSLQYFTNISKRILQLFTKTFFTMFHKKKHSTLLFTNFGSPIKDNQAVLPTQQVHRLISQYFTKTCIPLKNCKTWCKM